VNKLADLPEPSSLDLVDEATHALLVGDERTVVRVRGTHQGETELFGPPTGRQFEQESIAIHRIEDGKIVEEWNQWDNLSVLQQLGIAPEQ
jgi:predicted ester cyclase